MVDVSSLHFQVVRWSATVVEWEADRDLLEIFVIHCSIDNSDAIRIYSNEDRYEIMPDTSERVSGVKFSSCTWVSAVIIPGKCAAKGLTLSTRAKQRVSDGL
ncbi:hypothetical protein Btru_077114 [Bulinus truncatus]|nr:hypothetical protein Btru_077114 [Bulinus truncatus]